MPALAPVMALLAAASFFFAAAESALFTLGLWRARRLAEHSPTAGALLIALLGQPDDLLATLALGNTAANAGLVAFGLLAAIHHGWPNAVFGAGLLLLLLIGCEVMPKALAVRDPETWSIRVAKPLAWLVWVSRPVRMACQWSVNRALKPWREVAARMGPKVADEEFTDLFELAHQHGAIDAHEKELILRILALDHRTAREVMRPRARMVTLPDNLTPDEFAAEARRCKHHRVPLYDESPGNIVAILNTYTLLLDGPGRLDEAIEFPSFVPESMNLLRLFESLQRQKRGLAIVVDEFGESNGLITAEDIIEAVVGPLRGEGEAPGFVVETLAAGRWRVNGLTRIDDFRRLYPALDEDPAVETMGGLALRLAEVVPQPGQVLNHRGLRLTVKAADERRVRELLVERVSSLP